MDDGTPLVSPAALARNTAGVQSSEEIQRNILGVTMDLVVENLTGRMGAATTESEPGAAD